MLGEGKIIANNLLCDVFETSRGTTAEFELYVKSLRGVT
jgi:hypothetical protein